MLATNDHEGADFVTLKAKDPESYLSGMKRYLFLGVEVAGEVRESILSLNYDIPIFIFSYLTAFSKEYFFQDVASCSFSLYLSIH